MEAYSDPKITQLYTSSWTGERSKDGRPKASNALMERLKDITLEEAWTPMYKQGYRNQSETRLKQSNPGVRLIGRAVTCAMVPSRPDVHLGMLEYGWEKGYVGYFNQWVVDGMTENDVLVADGFDKIRMGTFLGGNLATSIKARAKPGGGAVIWGGIRDLEQIQAIDNFQVYYRGVDPAYINDEMMMAYNLPCRIGDAVCVPGDIVLGTPQGVIFIPPHLAEQIAIAGEKTKIRDVFGMERLEQKVYSGADIDASVWSKEIMDDFLRWFKESPQADNFRHLDWEPEIEASNGVMPGTWTGLS